MGEVRWRDSTRLSSSNSPPDSLQRQQYAEELQPQVVGYFKRVFGILWSFGFSEQFSKNRQEGVACLNFKKYRNFYLAEHK